MNAALSSQLSKDLFNILLGGMPTAVVDTTKILMESSAESLVITKPDRMDWKQAASFCSAKHEEQEASTSIVQVWVTFPWVLAVALEDVLKKYSTTHGKTKQISVPGKNGVSKNCVWGEFNIASLGIITTGAEYNETLRRPECSITFKHARKNALLAKALLDEVDAQVKAAKWIKGTALQLPIGQDGTIDIFAAPQVVEVPIITSYDLVLPEYLKAELEAGVLFPLKNMDACQRAGLSSRRGALFAGRPGTGKTMAARIAARTAIDNEWGVLYIADSRALEQTLSIAAALAPCLVICEDIDRQLGGERDATTDRILNALDGLDRSKPVALICTSNAIATLPSALLRAGRLDTILIFKEPDDAAARTLVLRYLGKYAPENLAKTDCAGLLPASIKEVAQRSILHALAAEASGGSAIVTERMVLNCAKAVREQQTILENAEKPRERDIDYTLEVIDRGSAQDEAIEGLARRVSSAKAAAGLTSIVAS